MSDRPYRQSIRLQNYDYTQSGAYFVTICAQDRQCLFGEVNNEQLAPSTYGLIVQACWDDLPNHYTDIDLDAFVIMPNHVHGIVVLSNTPTVGAGLRPARPRPLSEIVRAFKSFSSRRINEMRESPGIPIWQRNYYEHVIRSEKSLEAIREYIENNPSNWALDAENSTMQRT